MANESALKDGNHTPTLLFEQGGETRRVSDINPLPVSPITLDSGLISTQMERTGNGTVVLLTPSAGKKINVKGVVITSEALSGFEADIRFAASGKVIHKIYRADQSGDYIPLNIEGSVNESLNGVIVGNGAGQRIFFMINYLER